MTPAYIYIYIYICVCVCVCMCVYVYIYTYTHTYIYIYIYHIGGFNLVVRGPVCVCSYVLFHQAASSSDYSGKRQM